MKSDSTPVSDDSDEAVITDTQEAASPVTIIGAVASLTQTNHIGTVANLNVQNTYSRGSRPINRTTVIANDTHLTGEQKKAIADLIRKLGDLMIRADGVLNDPCNGNRYGYARRQLYDYCGEVNINTFPKAKYQDAIGYLYLRINAQLDNERVIKSPPGWWRDELISRIHSSVHKNGIPDEKYHSYLWDKYGVRSSIELKDDELAEFWRYSIKGRFAAVKDAVSPRDRNQRLHYLRDYLESIGGFDRPDTGMRYEELLEELNKRYPGSFDMVVSAFRKWVGEAKHDLPPFKMRTGRPAMPKARARTAALRTG